MATKTLHITRTFNAPIEKVWDAFTKEEHVMKWWGPKDFTSPAATIDFRVGGKYNFCMHGPAGTQFDMDMWSGGEYLEIEPMKKIVATDNFTDKDGNLIDPKEIGMPGDWSEQMVVTFHFKDLGNGKTELKIEHKGHPAEMAGDAEAGWNQSLDKLEAAL